MKAHAQCLSEPGPAITCRTPSDPDQNLNGPGGNGFSNQLPRSEGCRPCGVALMLRHKQESRRFCQLNNRGPGPVHPSPSSTMRLSQRTGDRGVSDSARPRAAQNIERSFTAIRNGAEVKIISRPLGPPSERHQLRCFLSSPRALPTVSGDQDSTSSRHIATATDGTIISRGWVSVTYHVYSYPTLLLRSPVPDG